MVTLDKPREFMAAPPATEERRYYNPVQKDYATYLETSDETAGKRTLLEIEVAAGGGNTPHIHKSYAEHFEVLRGTLEVSVGGETQTLRPGEKAVAPPGALHHFRNRTDAPTVFLVDLRPGSPGFEKALRIAYGLAGDGLVRPDGTPRNLYHLALLIEWSDIGLPGVFGALDPLLRVMARRARRKGIDRELEARYIA